MELNCPHCDSTMSEDEPGVDKTEANFVLTFSCYECNTSAEVSFNADEDVEITYPDGEDDTKNIHDLIQ